MRAFVTGGTGFIGGHVIRLLRDRGDDVVALVRTPSKATALTDLGCTLVQGGLDDVAVLSAGMKGCDSVFHIAAAYKVGIPKSERPQMHATNVTGTENVIDAAVEVGVSRILYVSTVGYFGNTHGKVIDETYERPAGEFLSCYDETKYLAHQIALAKAKAGAPVVIAQPGGVYGPGDHSELGNLIDQARTGKLKMMVFPELGFNLAHVEDISAGIVLVHDKGTLGEAYVIGGEISTMGKLVKTVCELAGRKAPRFTIPAPMIRMSIPLAPIVTKVMGLPPNLKEAIKAADGVTYWATDAKAQSELGYDSRNIAEGMKATLAAIA